MVPKLPLYLQLVPLLKCQGKGCGHWGHTRCLPQLHYTAWELSMLDKESEHASERDEKQVSSPSFSNNETYTSVLSRLQSCTKLDWLCRLQKAIGNFQMKEERNGQSGLYYLSIACPNPSWGFLTMARFHISLIGMKAIRKTSKSFSLAWSGTLPKVCGFRKGQKDHSNVL